MSAPYQSRKLMGNFSIFVASEGGSPKPISVRVHQN